MPGKNTEKSVHKILHVSDYHINATYSSIRIPPEEFLHAARKAKNLSEFVDLLKRPKNCPLRTLADNIRHAHEIVLTGDMVEFINQDIDHNNETMINIGLAFHRLLLASANGKQVHEMLGNHERFKLYEKALNRLSTEFHNYHVNHSHYRTGNALFIHGDRDLQPHMFEGEAAYTQLHRDRSREGIHRVIDDVGNKLAPPMLKVAQKTLEVALDTLPGQLIPPFSSLLRPARHQARIIMHNLAARLAEECDGVQHIFLGHCHVPYNDLVMTWERMIEGKMQKRKVTFHNGGVALSSVASQCNPMMINMQAGKVVSVEQLGVHKSGIPGM